MQSERRCKFIRRLDLTEGECGNACKDIKAYMMDCMLENASERSIMEKELKVKMHDVELADTYVAPAGSHVQVIHVSLTVQLAMACAAFGKTDAGKKANAEFQKLFLKDDSPSSSSDAPASTTADAPLASDTQTSIRCSYCFGCPTSQSAG